MFPWNQLSEVVWGGVARLADADALPLQTRSCLEGSHPLLMGCGVRMADLLLVINADLHVGDGTGEVAFLLVGQTQVPTADRFPAAVADLTRNDQLLLVQTRWRGGARPGQRRPGPGCPAHCLPRGGRRSHA